MPKNGKVIIVFGATGDIGQALCSQFDLAGATVIMIGRDEQKLRSIQEDLNPKGNHQAVIINDLMNGDAIIQQFRRWGGKFGKIDAIVVSLGEWQRADIDTPAAELAEIMDRAFKTHVLIPAVIATAAQQTFRKFQWAGMLFYFSSHVTVRPNGWRLSRNLAYRAAKGGAENYLAGLSGELSEAGKSDFKIRILQPGIVNTPKNRAALIEAGSEKEAIQVEQLARWILDQLGTDAPFARQPFLTKAVLA